MKNIKVVAVEDSRYWQNKLHVGNILKKTNEQSSIRNAIAESRNRISVKFVTLSSIISVKEPNYKCKWQKGGH